MAAQGRSPLAAVLGPLVLFVSMMVWLVGYNVLAAGRFSTLAVTALKSTPGQQLIVAEVSREANAAATARNVTIPPRFETVVLPAAVHGVVTARAFSGIVTPAVRDAYTGLIDDPEQPIGIKLENLREGVRNRIQQDAPALVQYLPPAGSLGTLTFTPSDKIAGLGKLVRLVDFLRNLPWIGAIIAAMLLIAAFVMARDRFRMARWAGGTLLAIALLSVLIRYVAPPITRNLVSGSAAAKNLTSDVTADLLSNFWRVALTSGLVGLALLLIGVLKPRRAPRGI